SQKLDVFWGSPYAFDLLLDVKQLPLDLGPQPLVLPVHRHYYAQERVGCQPKDIPFGEVFAAPHESDGGVEELGEAVPSIIRPGLGRKEGITLLRVGINHKRDMIAENRGGVTCLTDTQSPGRVLGCVPRLTQMGRAPSAFVRGTPGAPSGPPATVR